MTRLTASLILAFLCCLPGCGGAIGGSELAVVPSEREATRILVELAQRGVESATVKRQTVDRKAVHIISVSSDDLANARNILVQLDLPREERGGLAAMVNSAGLIPTKSDERAKLMYAIAQELEQTLETCDRVVRARVHVVMPEQSLSLSADPKTAPKPSATVLIKYVIPAMKPLPPEATAEEKARADAIALAAAAPPLEETKVKSLVARSVQGLDETNVFVTYTTTQMEPTKAAAAAAAAAITPGATAPATTASRSLSSYAQDPMFLKLFGAVVVLGLLCIFLIFKLVRKGKKKPAKP